MDKNQTLVSITVNGQKISAPAKLSIVEALWYAESARIKGVGCLDGVCGSCRVLVRRAGSAEVKMELACQAHIEADMQVIFPPFPKPSRHRYQLTDIKSPSEVLPQFHQTFPEANHCRDCGGCTAACPKGIDVQRGVNFAAKGRFREAGELFIECVMCDMCMTSCPEMIAPHFVGLFSRRVTAYFHIQPPNLRNRLAQLRQGKLAITATTDHSTE